VRTHVVTGAASGIGRATRGILEARGDRVVGVDLRDTDVICDLADREERGELRTRVVELAPDGVDAVHANAGLSIPSALPG
jgi:nucleoside-diphosphate-sugar epimerase